MQQYGGTLNWVSYTKLLITLQPQSTSVEVGETVSFVVVAEGDNPCYQWQYRAGDVEEWSDSTESSANTASLSIIADAAVNGFQYRCVVSD